MSKRFGYISLLAPVALSSQRAPGSSLMSEGIRRTRASGRALLRAVRYQARSRLLRRSVMARLGERSRLWVDLHHTSASASTTALGADRRPVAQLLAGYGYLLYRPDPETLVPVADPGFGADVFARPALEAARS